MGKVHEMADARTYTGMWERYAELKRLYERMEDDAYDDGSTLSQYVGSEKLSKLVNDLDKLLDDSSGIADESERRKLQADTIAMLYPVELALADACLFECDQAAAFEDYCS